MSVQKSLRLFSIELTSLYSVHGGPHTEPILIDKDHEEGLSEMDILSEFAPLHVSAVNQLALRVTILTADNVPPRITRLSLRSAVSSSYVPLDPPLISSHRVAPACLKALPNHTSLLAFDTLFHKTLPEEVYTYAIPEADQEVPIPLRKVSGR